MADIPETPPASPIKAASEKRKPGRPATGQALSRATIQRQYRQRINSNVTKNTVEALDENLALRAQVLQLMNELEDAQMKVRVEFELGEKARARVRELERRLAEAQPAGSKKVSSEARYELQVRNYSDGEWCGMGAMPDCTFKTRSMALADLKLATEGKDDAPFRVLDRKTGKILTA
jgi:hypothetical protein